MTKTREITQDDIDSATRGLGLKAKTDRYLEKLYKSYAGNEDFAAKVIREACLAEMGRRVYEEMMADGLTDDDLRDLVKDRDRRLH